MIVLDNHMTYEQNLKKDIYCFFIPVTCLSYFRFKILSYQQGAVQLHIKRNTFQTFFPNAQNLGNIFTLVENIYMSHSMLFKKITI